MDERQSAERRPAERTARPLNEAATPATFFVSPHAISQFQKRICPLDGAMASRIIADGVNQAVNVARLPDGNTLRVRTRRPFPYEFRAYVVFDETRRSWVVTTVVRGDSCVTRKQRRKARAGLLGKARADGPATRNPPAGRTD